MSLSQNDMGRAFEYGIALSLSKILSLPITENTYILVAKQCFNSSSVLEQQNIIKASNQAVTFLVIHDNRLTKNNCQISLQSDQRGREGDVRDVIVHNNTLNQDVGISAKNRHWALKHSRLSARIDFGSEWFGIKCADSYFREISPIFEELKNRRYNKEKWRDIPDKKQRYYLPVLHAFQSEIKTLFENHGEVPSKLIKYLLGQYDYYKVIKENGEVSVLSFNIDNSLKWGDRLHLPTRIIEISQKPDSDTTIIMTFDQGWQISFRIHSASTMVEPSLKFDITIIGSPGISRHEIPYR